LFTVTVLKYKGPVLASQRRSAIDNDYCCNGT